jgi:CBS domain-containing protein
MTICPYCEHDNFDGVDVCEQCTQPLDDLHLLDPTSLVERGLLKDRVEMLQPKAPVVVTPDTPVSQVLQLLVEEKIGSVFGVRDQEVVGVFSERDALFRLNTEARQHADRPISDFMTSAPRTLSSTARIAFAVRMMDVGGYRHVPLVDEQNRPTGVISARDILAYLTERMRASTAAG